MRRRDCVVALTVLVVAAAFSPALAQRGGVSDRLKAMPGYARYEQMSPQIAGAVKTAAITPTWAADSKSFDYTFDGKRLRFDVATRKASDAPGDAAGGGRGRGGPGRGGAAPERGRQFTAANSPDGKHKAIYRDRNLWIGDTAGANAVQITTDGSAEKRVKYGTASWVYGEELGQVTAMWWSPDGSRLAYYRFDESKVPDYYLQMNQTRVYDSVDVEAYPKSGFDNPIVDLFVYDVNTRKTTHLDPRDGKPLTNDVLGYYVYGVNWSRDGSELLLQRANRRQNSRDFAACNPTSGACRVIVHEEWPTGWLDETPSIRWLADGKRFILTSERTGFANLYLYDLSGKLLSTITKHPFEVERISDIDEQAGVVYYSARDGDNFMKLQFHRVKLDGTGDVRLTDPAFNHTATLSPDRKYFVDVAQTHDVPPAARLADASNGRPVADIASSDLTQFNALGLKKVEMFTYLAADGKTQLHGTISFPSNFDPSRKYPVLVPVYGGPASASNTASERFATPSATTEYGFLVVNLNSRAVPGMGKRTLDAIYMKLGQVEMDDMAEGVKALWSRPYIDKNRVGIYGTSYGGYTSVVQILRHPEVFAAASAASPVTDWRHYDTIYTERYMWIPNENESGYDAGSAVKMAANLKGRLLLYYGTADNNVHPTNMMQLIQALQRANKSFEVQVGPDAGHSGVNQGRMMEFFIENLVMKPGSAAQN